MSTGRISLSAALDIITTVATIARERDEALAKVEQLEARAETGWQMADRLAAALRAEQAYNGCDFRTLSALNAYDVARSQR